MDGMYTAWDVVNAVRDEGFHFTPSMLRDYVNRGILPPALKRGQGPNWTRDHIRIAIAVRRDLENKPTLADLRDRYNPPDDEDDA